MPIKGASEEYGCNLSPRRAPGEDAGPARKYKHAEYVSILRERPASAALGVGQHGAEPIRVQSWTSPEYPLPLTYPPLLECSQLATLQHEITSSGIDPRSIDGEEYRRKPPGNNCP